MMMVRGKSWGGGEGAKIASNPGLTGYEMKSGRGRPGFEARVN